MLDRKDKRFIEQTIANVERQFKREDITNTDTEALKKLCALKIGHSERPVFAVFFLNYDGRLIAYKELFHGRLGDSRIYSRRILAEVISQDASGLVFAHCVPDNNTELTAFDQRNLEKLCQTLYNTGIQVKDYITVGKTTSSLREQGKLPSPEAKLLCVRECV